MKRDQFTEHQLQIIEQMQREVYERGLVWGFIYTLGAGVGISLAVLAANRWGHLFV